MMMNALLGIISFSNRVENFARLQLLSNLIHCVFPCPGATGDRGASLCHYKVKELGLRSAKLNLDPYFMRSSKNNFDVKEVKLIRKIAFDKKSRVNYFQVVENKKVITLQ